MKERRECDVSGGPGMLKEDKVSTQPSSLSHRPAAGFISSTQQERWFSFVPLKQVSLTGFMACCYMPSPRSVCMCLLVLKQQFFHCCFVAFFILQEAKPFSHTNTHKNLHLVGLIYRFNLVNLTRFQGLVETF